MLCTGLSINCSPHKPKRKRNRRLSPSEQKHSQCGRKYMTQQVQERVSTAHIAAAIESVLFVSGRPLECAELRRLLDIEEAALAEGLQALAQQLESQGRGIRLQRLGTQVQLVT